MIFYFSGSGNSYAVAKQIADKIDGEKVVSLAGFDDFKSCQGATIIGIVFPCYIGQAPDIVLEFKEKLFQYISKDNAYIFCVSTYANSSATSHFAFRDNIHAWFEVRMPENDIANSHAPTKEKEAQLLANAKIKTDSFINDILDEKQIAIGSRPLHGLLLKLVSKPMRRMFQGFSEHLYADDSCIKCEQCIKYCPLKNISFDTEPIWGSNCANCFGCVNRCPRQSIQFKKKTVGKKRYIHPDYKNVHY